MSEFGVVLLAAILGTACTASHPGSVCDEEDASSGLDGAADGPGVDVTVADVGTDVPDVAHACEATFILDPIVVSRVAGWSFCSDVPGGVPMHARLFRDGRLVRELMFDCFDTPIPLGSHPLGHYELAITSGCTGAGLELIDPAACEPVEEEVPSYACPAIAVEASRCGIVPISAVLRPSTCS